MAQCHRRSTCRSTGSSPRRVRTTEEAERWKRDLIFTPAVRAADHLTRSAGALAAGERRRHQRSLDAARGDRQGTERAGQRHGTGGRTGDRPRRRLPQAASRSCAHRWRCTSSSPAASAATPIRSRCSASSRSSARASSTRSISSSWRSARRRLRRSVRPTIRRSTRCSPRSNGTLPVVFEVEHGARDHAVARHGEGVQADADDLERRAKPTRSRPNSRRATSA